MPPKLSFVNARGHEIVLDDDERSFIAEIEGREGFEAPTLEMVTVEYANGAEDVVASLAKTREVTCYFWAETLDVPAFDKAFRNLKSELVQVGKKSGQWGELRVRRTDGSYAVLHCLYSEGLDAMTRDAASRVQFHLTFTASDPWFYDMNKTVRTFGISEQGAGLHFGKTTFFGQSTHFGSSDADHTETITCSGSRIYPEIAITGPARNIRIINSENGCLLEMDSSFELLRGETLTITTKPLERSAVWTKENGTQVNAFKYMTATTALDWHLEYGDNVLKFRNSVNSPLAKCTLTYQQGWLSV